MKNITYLRLINRAFISYGKEKEFIDLIEKYQIAVGFCTNGAYEDGPFIDRVFKSTNSLLSIEYFKEFCGEIVHFLDMYRGVKDFTYLEFAVTIIDDDNLVSKKEVVVFKSTENECFKIQSLNLDKEKIRKLKKWEQKRITLEDFFTNKQLLYSSMTV